MMSVMFAACCVTGLLLLQSAHAQERNFVCDGSSLYASSEDCRAFIRVPRGSTRASIELCSQGNLFNEVTGICDQARNVTCNGRPYLENNLPQSQPRPRPWTFQATQAPVSDPDPTTVSLYLTTPNGLQGRCPSVASELNVYLRSLVSSYDPNCADSCLRNLPRIVTSCRRSRGFTNWNRARYSVRPGLGQRVASPWVN